MPAARALAHPPLLAPGARVALVAPAGRLAGNDDLTTALANARSFGWDAIVGDHAMAAHGYFAGTDDARRADLASALQDPTVDGIWCLRGGYGSMRLLDSIDFELLHDRPRALVGYSDVTALHCAVNARAGLVAHHGPTARSQMTPFTRDSLARAVVTGADSCGVAPDAHAVRGGRAHGRLAGGNLAMVAALCGSRYAADLEGAIVVLEDVNEPVYRIDRMFQQLLLGGGLRGCAALVLGAFTNMPDGGDDAGRAIHDVVQEIADLLQVPVLSGAPFGHVGDMWTLPLGAMAELDADAGSLSVIQP